MIDLISPFKAYIKPWKEVKNLKGSLVDGLVYAEIGAVILAVITFFFGGVSPLTSSLSGVMSLAILVSVPIGILVESLICYVIAKLLGGKGGFDKQTFSFGALSLPQSLLLAIAIALTAILVPNAGVLVTLFLEILLAIWLSVLLFFVLKEVHGLTTSKVIVAILLFVGVEFIMGFISYFL
jgi:hypothetical protein